MKIDEYCKRMLLDVKINNEDDRVILELEGKEYIVLPIDTFLFDQEFSFVPIDNDPKDGYIYRFNGRWYTQDNSDTVQLLELKNIGKAVSKIPTNNFLGIHSGTELLNGVGLYKDWIKKAKFLGVTSLGIVEKNTLAGVIEFQAKCKDNEIKPITGMSITVQDKDEHMFELKCYAKDFSGWQNLLKFNKIINVEEKGIVTKEFLDNNKDGLILVVDPKSTEYKEYFEDFDYFQLDSAIFSNEDTDETYVSNAQSFSSCNIKPVAICDAYYIEKDDAAVREILWNIAKAYDDKSENQYFKSNDQYIEEINEQYENNYYEDDRLKNYIDLAISNQDNIVRECNFIYDTTSRHLPKYQMSEEEAKQYGTKENLFTSLIKEGFKTRKIPIEKQEEYLKRVKYEVSILKRGNVVDYFLTTYNIMKFARSKNILTGIGRGSAGGCLVSYLLNIVHLDPIKLDLMFERFLNEGRMGKMVECKAFEIETEDGTKYKLNERSVLKINRDGKELNIFVDDLLETDLIVKIEE